MMKVVRVLWTELHLESSPMRAACTDRLFQYERTRREDVAVGILVVDCRRRHFRPTVASCHVISNPEPHVILGVSIVRRSDQDGPSDLHWNLYKFQYLVSKTLEAGMHTSTTLILLICSENSKNLGSRV